MLRLNANAIIENGEGKILFIKLKKGPYKDQFSIPGGGVNFGEWSSQAAAREIYEETGIKIDYVSLIPIGFCELIKTSKEDHRVVLLLHGKATGDPIDTKEANAFWCDSKEIQEKLIPFARESLRIFRNKELHFKINQD